MQIAFSIEWWRSLFFPTFPPQEWDERQLDSVIWVEQRPDGWRRHSIEKAICIHPTVAVADYDQDGRLDIVVGNFVWMGPDQKPFLRYDYVTLFTARQR